MKYLLLISVLFAFSACTFYNPFIPPLHTTYGEPDDSIGTTCGEPISSDPMYRATMKPYTVMGKKYCPSVVKVGDTFTGTASWYGDAFHGRQTSNGEYYNMYDLTAAHKTLPINTLVKVTNLKNNLSTTVRINDRGPFVENRIIDLSHQAAQEIDMIRSGTAPVKLEIVHFDNSANKYAHKRPIIKEKKQSVWKRFTPESGTMQDGQEEQKVVAGGEYAIQIASFSYKDRALALKEKCYNRSNSYKPYIKEKVFNKQTIYKVMLSGFKSIQEAKDFINASNYKGAFIVRD